jgi:hypothetical protein
LGGVKGDVPDRRPLLPARQPFSLPFSASTRRAAPPSRRPARLPSYSKQWEVTVKRLGRWIDFENDYKTLDPSFMESVWWVFWAGL